MGGQQGTNPNTMEPHRLLQQHKSNRTRVRKKSHEKKRVRSRNNVAVGGGDAGIGNMNGQNPLRNGAAAKNESEFIVSQSSDDEDNNPTPRQIKKRSPRGKPLKRSQNNPQYSNTVHSEHRHQNNLMRISPLGKPLHHQGFSAQKFSVGNGIVSVNSPQINSTYKVDSVMYSQHGLLQVPPMSNSPHLLQGQVDPGARRSQASISFSRKSLREIPKDELRRSGVSNFYVLKCLAYVLT